MFIAAAVISVVLAAMLTFSARGKLVKDPTVMGVMTHVGVPVDRVWLLAVAEIAAAVGLLIGLFWWPLGVAAAIGVVIYFVLAVSAHLRVGDRQPAQLAPPAVILVLAVVALFLRLTTT
jgi:uncharacterized membrane protein YphA (DoxX/SURF4 family)